MTVAIDPVGQSVRRREDHRLLTGGGRYVSDIGRPGMVYLAIARSPHGHAAIRLLDTSAALATLGVVAVVTADDLVGVKGMEAARLTPEMPLPPAPLLASGSVHFVGQPIVAVVAETAAAAVDGVARLRIDYEPQPAVIDPVAALAEGAPLAFPELGTNLAYRQARTGGDVDGGLARADHIVRLRLAQNRIAAVPMEARGAVAEWDDALGQLTVWVGAQAIFRARASLAAAIEVPETAVRVIAPDVGGGFGVKGGLYHEEILTAVLARRLNRPVKWFSTRQEDLQTTQHAREQIQEVEAGFTSAGDLLAVRIRAYCNLGAGARGAGSSGRVAQCITGCYRVPAAASELIGVYTNTTPTGAFRGAGRPEAAYAIERIMDEAAAVLGLDPVAIRRRNFVQANEFPHRAPTGITLDSGDYEAGLAECLRLLDYDRARQEQAAARARGEIVGIGLATYLELSGGGWESGGVRVLANGLVEALTGSTEQGQGHATTWSQIVASVLGVPIEQVTVRQGDTTLLAAGIGSFGSRSVVTGGSALHRSAEEIKRRMLQLAAHRLEAAVEDLEWGDGSAWVRGAPSRRLSFREMAGLAYGGGLPPGGEPGLEAIRYFNADGEAFSSGAYAAVVRIDPATGVVTIQRFVAVDDCGRAINPKLVEGQVIGGLAQGLGQAMCELVAYDEQGQLLSGSLMDYAVPHAATMPPLVVSRVETPAPRNPLGAKGIGEGGTIGAPPALVNAVVDALRPLGLTNVDMPLTAERLWRLITAARAGQGS